MDILFIVLQLFVATVNTLTLAMLCGSVFKRRFSQPIHGVSLCAIILLSFLSLSLIQGAHSILRMLVFFLLGIVILCLYKGSTLSRICMAALHFLISGAAETIVLSTILIIGKITLAEMMKTPIIMMMGNIAPVGIVLVLCLLLSKLLYRWRNHLTLPLWEWLMVFLFVAFTIFELYLAATIIQAGNPMMYLIPIQGLVLLFMNVALLLLLDKLAAKYRFEKENLILQEQMRHYRQSLQASSLAYETQRSLTHDFDNCLLTMGQLMQNGQCEEAYAYLQKVRTGVKKAEVVVSTNNPIADAVLNQKYMKAQTSGIQMHFLINDLSKFPLAADQLAMTLSNLLDNAIEACECCMPIHMIGGKKSIYVKLLLEPSLATLSIKNTSEFVDITEDDSIVTTKEDGNGHGFGLKNSKKILLDAGFEFALCYEDGWFQFTTIKML